MIDLHTHTSASDGSESPRELFRLACEAGLQAIAITDHDTFAGVDEAITIAAAGGPEVIRGIELSAKDGLHLLAYFFQEPGEPFRRWVQHLVETRRQRNAAMAERLQSLGVDVALQEAEALGAVITGRVHFARLLIDKGYTASYQESFERYLGESAPAYVERADPHPREVLERVRASGGIVSLAHPGRFRKTAYAANPESRSAFLCALVDDGLAAMEVWHSDHPPAEVHLYAGLSRHYHLIPTGGSDFHGVPKPSIRVGTGRQGNLEIGLEVLENLRRQSPNS